MTPRISHSSRLQFWAVCFRVLLPSRWAFHAAPKDGPGKNVEGTQRVEVALSRGRKSWKSGLEIKSWRPPWSRDFSVQRATKAKKLRRQSGCLVSSPLAQNRQPSRTTRRDLGNDRSHPPPFQKGDHCSRRPTKSGKLKRLYAPLSEFGGPRTKVTSTECFGSFRQAGCLSLRRDLASRKMRYDRPPRARLKGCRLIFGTK